MLRDAPSNAATSGATPFSVQQFDGPSVPEASPTDAPITYGSQPAQFIVALARPVGTLKKGDILTAHWSSRSTRGTLSEATPLAM